MKSGSPTIEVNLLGTPQVRRGGAIATADTKKAIAVVAMLAVERRRLSRDRLCAVFWPESPAARARSALRRTLSSARGLVGRDLLDADRESIELRLDGAMVDVLEFLGLCDGKDFADLADAAALYRGEFLDGFSVRGSPEFEDWQRGEAERLRRKADQVFSRLSSTLSAAGDHEEAIEAAERRLALDVLNESAHRDLMLAEAWAGRRSRAIERYRVAVRTLDDELGVAPLEETTRMYERIRRGEIPSRPVANVDAPVAQTRARKPPERLRLRGRDDELRALMDVYEKAAFSGRAVGVAGEAGIGKSVLVREIAERCRRVGGRVVLARGHDTERDLSYAVAVQVLRGLGHEAGGGVDDRYAQPVASLFTGSPGPAAGDSQADPDAERIRFLDALHTGVVNLAASDRPALIAVDDFHLADDASADFLGYLVRRLEPHRIAVVLTWRDADVSAEGPVAQVVAGLRAANEPAVIPLRRLEPEVMGRIVHDAMSAPVDGDRVAEIVAASSGIPLLAVALAESSDEGISSGEAALRGLLSERLARLGEAAHQVLAAAAVLGRSFRPDLVRAVSGRTPEEVDEALDQLETAGVLERDGSGLRYDFSVTQWRGLAFDDVPAGRRRLLHRRASEALAVSAPRASWNLGEAAGHAEAAGDRRRAAQLYFDAGVAARSVYANAEAEQWFRSALTLGYPAVAQIREALGDLATLRGDYTVATSEYEAVASAVDPADRPRIEHKLGGVYARRGDWATADSFYRAAFEIEQDPGGELLADMAVNLERLGNHDQARDVSAHAMARAVENGANSEIARAANTAGLLARASGHHHDAVSHLESARRSATVAGDDVMLVAVLNNLALTHGDRGDHREAVALLDLALERCRQVGDRHREAALLSNRGDALFALGDATAAAESVKESARILAEIGEEPERLVPEVWSLREW